MSWAQVYQFVFDTSHIIGANLALTHHLYLVIVQGLPPSVCIMNTSHTTTAATYQLGFYVLVGFRSSLRDYGVALRLVPHSLEPFFRGIHLFFFFAYWLHIGFCFIEGVVLCMGSLPFGLLPACGFDKLLPLLNCVALCSRCWACSINYYTLKKG